MKFFLDTEFIERGSRYPIELISVALVADTGQELYAVSSDFDPEHANDFVRANVLPNLFACTGKMDPTWSFGPVPNWYIADRIRRFILLTNGTDSRPEFWGYYADYDWVLFCQLFGAMSQLPQGYPMFCRDLKQWCVEIGDPKLPAQATADEHNALLDARWNAQAWGFLAQAESDYRNARVR